MDGGEVAIYNRNRQTKCHDVIKTSPSKCAASIFDSSLQRHNNSNGMCHRYFVKFTDF